MIPFMCRPHIVHQRKHLTSYITMLLVDSLHVLLLNEHFDIIL